MSEPKKRRVGDAVVEALDAAKAELEERERALEQREEALRKALEGVEHEKRLMAGCTPGDVLRLNIGGTKCHASRKTLCIYEKSLLAARFSGRWDDSIDKDEDGCFFIDHPPELFMPLLNYLRAKAIEMPRDQFTIPRPSLRSALEKDSAHDMIQLENKVLLADFKRMVEYYGLTNFVFPQQWRFLGGAAPCLCQAFGGAEPSVECSGFTTLGLQGNCADHAVILAIQDPNEEYCRRFVKDFEVVLDDVERPQIGWYNPQDFKTNPPDQGIGEKGTSIALDGVRGGVVFLGDLRVRVPQLSLGAGSVVRCEVRGGTFHWRVDGEEVAVLDSTTLNLNEVQSSILRSNLMRPGISGKGKWHISQFTYSA